MSQSFSTVVYASSDATWETNKIALGVRDLDLLGSRQFNIAQGKRGTRQEYACRTSDTIETVAGGFNIYPTAAELDWLMNYAFGTNSGTPWVPGETLPSIWLWAKKGGIQTYKYTTLKTNRFVLSGAETQMLNLRVDYVGGAETAVSDLTVGATVVDCATVPAFSSIVLTIGGTAYSIKQFALTIDNRIAAGQIENATSRSVFESEGLSVTLDVTAAFRADTLALYRKAIAGDNGATLAFSDGTSTYTVTFGNLKIPGNGPTVPESGEVTMSLSMMAMRTVAAPTFSIAKV